MAQSSEPISWWIALLPAGVTSVIMTLFLWITMRQRRWRDLSRLGRPVSMPPEHLQREPKTVRDMVVGEEAYVGRFAILVSKRRRRVFVRWSADLRDAPDRYDSPFAPLRIRRLKKGFSLTVRPGVEFDKGSVVWGSYAPVIEIVQLAPSDVLETKQG